MRSKALTLATIFVLLLAAGSVAGFAYDSARGDRIAEGVTIGGVDVGGLSATEARELVRSRVAARIERPIAVTHGKLRFNLSAEDARVRADVGGMVDEALAASRDGNVVTRLVRDLTGGEERVDVDTRATFSRAAARSLVARVRDRLDREPQDATLDFPSLAAVKEQAGIRVRSAELSRLVATALTSPGDRDVEAPVQVTKPDVTRAELAQEYPLVLVADRANFQLRVYEDLELSKTYTVAFGAAGYDTPTGLYHIQNKAIDPAWTVPNSDWAGDLAGTVVPGGTPENPLKARWLGIYDGVGVHGTDDVGSLGTAASHGCIRMSIPDVTELYDQVPVQTPIYIG
ncbi:MAG: L,D-transpeptidase family protein [Thermoleophilaceae bacterium]